MSLTPNLRDTEQMILGDARDATYGTLDVTPMIETGVGVSQRLGYQAPLPTSSFPVNAAWDYTALVQAALTDTWTFKTGGAGGTTVATIVITYTSAAKTTIDNVVRT